jgi:hypothetical protein
MWQRQTAIPLPAQDSTTHKAVPINKCVDRHSNQRIQCWNGRRSDAPLTAGRCDVTATSSSIYSWDHCMARQGNTTAVHLISQLFWNLQSDMSQTHSSCLHQRNEQVPTFKNRSNISSFIIIFGMTAFYEPQPSSEVFHNSHNLLLLLPVASSNSSDVHIYIVSPSAPRSSSCSASFWFHCKHSFCWLLIIHSN